MGVVLGIDVSTTATKAILVDEAGRILGIASSEYGFEQPHPLWSEGYALRTALETFGARRRSTARERDRG